MMKKMPWTRVTTLPTISAIRPVSAVAVAMPSQTGQPRTTEK